jgi:hypothetical protein
MLTLFWYNYYFKNEFLFQEQLKRVSAQLRNNGYMRWLIAAVVTEKDHVYMTAYDCFNQSSIY